MEMGIIEKWLNEENNDVLKMWFMLRCKIQNGPQKDDSDEAAKNFLHVFCEEYDKNHPESSNQNIDDIKVKEEFQNYLVQHESDDDIWGDGKEHAKDFIEKVAAYRRDGVQDSDIEKEVMSHAKYINNDPLRYIYELIQNADDCDYDYAKKTPEMCIEISGEGMTIRYPEKGMTWSDILAITTIGRSNKGKKKKSKRIIGEKGRGFKTIYSVCEKATIRSGFYSFELIHNSLKPKWVDYTEDKRYEGTKMVLSFKNSISSDDAQQSITNNLKDSNVFDRIINKYGVEKDTSGKISLKKEKMLSSCPILFTNNISSIRINNCSSNEELYISKEPGNAMVSQSDVKGVKLKYKYSKNGETKEEELDCLWIEKNTSFTYEEYTSRYKDVFESKEEFEKKEFAEAICYPSVIVVPKDVSDIKKGKLYSYLPTDMDIEVPLAIQIPFELNEDRSCMFIKGSMNGNEHPDVNDYETTKWNKKLFDEVFRYDAINPCLLQLAYEGIRTWAKEQGKIDQSIDIQDIVLGYIPAYMDNNHKLFSSETSKKECNSLNEYCVEDDKNVIFETYRSIPLVRGMFYEDKWLSAAEDPIMFDEMVSDIIRPMNNDSISSLLCCVFDGQGDKASVERIVPFYKSEKLEHISINPVDLGCDNNRKSKFLNCLLDKGGDAAYKRIIESYVSKEKSVYFPYDMGDVKIIKMLNGDRWCEKDAHIWIVADDADVTKKYESNEDIAVFAKNMNSIDTDGKKNYKISQGLDEGKTPIEMLQCILNLNPYKDPNPSLSPDYSKVTEVQPYSYRQVIHFLNLCVCLLPLDNDKSKHFSNIIDFCEASKTNNPDEVPDKVIQLIQEKVWKRRVGKCRIHTSYKIRYDERRNSYLAYREELAKELKEAPDNKEVKKIFQDFELLGIFLHLKSKCQEKYELPPITNWTTTIIKAINKAPISVKDKKSFDFSKNDQLEECVNDQVKKEFEKLNSLAAAGLPAKADIYLYPFENDTESVRFVSGDKLVCIFNKAFDDEELIEHAEDLVKSLSEDAPVLLRAEEIRKEIRDNKSKLYRDPIRELNEVTKIDESLQNLRQLCAIDAHFSMDTRPDSGSNHEIWNELLQNANDHIPSDACVVDRVLDISVQGNVLELKYPDKGFSVRDFFAVCTSGNSGNKESGENLEGNKGTGFKSIYNLFRKVTIKSYDIQCVLEDVERTVSIVKNLEVQIFESNEKTVPKTYYPIPEFCRISDAIFEGTIISLELKAGKTIEDIKKILFGDSSDPEKSYEQSFIDQKAFLFLDHIACFKFNVNGEEFSFDKETYISEKFFDYTEELELDAGIRDRNPRWKDRVWPDEKQSVRFLFPKEYLDSDSIKDEEKPVYCTLPISKYKLAVPFYVNIPLLELNDERKNLHDSLNYWNKCILKAAFDALKKVFEDNNSEPESGKACDGLNLTNLYRFFPYKYSVNPNPVYQDLYVRDILADVKFLRTTKGDGNESIVQARSIADNQWLFLPDYMYWWFGKKEGLDKFTCENWFLFYEGILPLNESGTLSGKGGHSIVKKKLFYNRAFPTIDEIVSYVSKKAQNISLNKSVTAEDAVAIQDIQENDFCILLKEIFKNNANNISVKQQVIGSFLEFYLGSHLREGMYHCLGYKCNSIVLSEPIGGYISIAPILDMMSNYFKDPSLKGWNYNDKMFGFSNLIDSVYYDQKPEQEPSERSERIYTDRETLKKICEALMREKDSCGWRLIAEETKTYLKCDNAASRLKLLIENKILDMDFVTDIVASVDWAERGCYRMMVRSLLNEEFRDEKTKEYKISELFKLFIKLDKKNNICDTWEPSYKRYISDCKQEDLEGVRFSITNSNKEIQPIVQALKVRFDEKVCDDTKAEKKDVWGRKNNGARIELAEIVGERIYIVKDCHTAGRNLYCFAQKGDKEAVLLFTENAFGSVLRDLYECTEYSETTPYMSMDCFRTNILRPWMDYSDLEESELTAIKNSVTKIWRELKDDRDSLICKLVSPYTIRMGKQLIKARGYGGEKWEEKQCPVCDARLLAESSVLKIRNVSYSKDGRLKHLPLLLCNNCSDSFRYANDVQWNPEDPNRELQLDQINNNDMLKLKITFEFPAETKILEVRMSYLLRVIWWAIIEDVE